MHGRQPQEHQGCDDFWGKPSGCLLTIVVDIVYVLPPGSTSGQEILCLCSRACLYMSYICDY